MRRAADGDRVVGAISGYRQRGSGAEGASAKETPWKASPRRYDHLRTVTQSASRRAPVSPSAVPPCAAGSPDRVGPWDLRSTEYNFTHFTPSFRGWNVDETRCDRVSSAQLPFGHRENKKSNRCPRGWARCDRFCFPLKFRSGKWKADLCLPEHRRKVDAVQPGSGPLARAREGCRGGCR